MRPALHLLHHLRPKSMNNTVYLSNNVSTALTIRWWWNYWEFSLCRWVRIDHEPVWSVIEWSMNQINIYISPKLLLPFCLARIMHSKSICPMHSIFQHRCSGMHHYSTVWNQPCISVFSGISWLIQTRTAGHLLWQEWMHLCYWWSPTSAMYLRHIAG